MRVTCSLYKPCLEQREIILQPVKKKLDKNSILIEIKFRVWGKFQLLFKINIEE